MCSQLAYDHNQRLNLPKSDSLANQTTVCGNKPLTMHSAPFCLLQSGTPVDILATRVLYKFWDGSTTKQHKSTELFTLKLKTQFKIANYQDSFIMPKNVAFLQCSKFCFFVSADHRTQLPGYCYIIATLYYCHEKIMPRWFAHTKKKHVCTLVSAGRSV